MVEMPQDRRRNLGPVGDELRYKYLNINGGCDPNFKQRKTIGIRPFFLMPKNSGINYPVR